MWWLTKGLPLLLQPRSAASSSLLCLARRPLVVTLQEQQPPQRGLSSSSSKGDEAAAVPEVGEGAPRDGPLTTEEDRAREFREVVSRKDSIRMSPWKINLLARQIRGLPVVEALLQLQLSRKQKGPPIVGKVIQNASNLASIRYDLNPEDLYVAEAFINRGHIQKGIMIHGRGRFGMKRRAYSHVVVKVREIDFEAKIREAKNRFQRARWAERKRAAEEVRKARDERNSSSTAAAAAAQG